MPVPVGTASFQDIEDEFGGSHPITLTEYYGGAVGIPASGTISVDDFRGKSSIFTFSITTNQTNANLRTLAIAAGWDESTPVEATIDSGVTISGSVAGNSTAALTIDGAWAAGVTLFNNGIIRGRGGVGGAGANVSNGLAGSAGSTGGRALSVSSAVSIDNTLGVIQAGGGGGGGGGSGFTRQTLTNTNRDAKAAGGGGGGGHSSNLTAAGGAAGNGTANTYSNGRIMYNAAAGGTGNINTYGNGGTGARAQIIISNNTGQNAIGGTGGRGGNLGSSGAGGASASVGSVYRNGGGSGGAGGNAVNGDANITWIAVGTRTGTIT
jgi:hypothetical protein